MTACGTTGTTIIDSAGTVGYRGAGSARWVDGSLEPMTTSRTPIRLVSLVLLAALVTACGAAPAPTPTGTAGSTDPAPASGSSGDLADPSIPALDLVDPAGSVAAAEAALRQDVRDRAGLVNLGPGAVELAAEMDASAAKAFTQLRIDVGADALVGQVATLGPLAPSPGFNSWLVFGTLISVLGQMATEPIAATVASPPETVEIAGNTGTITTTTTIKSIVSGSRLSVDITMKTKGEVVDRTTGALLYAIDSIVTGHIDVDFCPDDGGTSAANVKLTSNEIYSQGGAGGGSSANGVSSEFSGSATITVGDDALIARVEGTQQGSEDARGGVSPAGGGEADLTASTRTMGDTIANDGAGNRLPGVPRAITLGGQGSTPAQQAAMVGNTVVFVETMVMTAAKEAEKLWRSGKCLELIVDPESGDVEANEVTRVTATLKHKIEGGELDKPVEATFSGKQSLDPPSGKQPAPATVSHTAGPEQGDAGTIVFRSVSNRGIAERTVTYTVGAAGWTTNADTPLGQIRGLKCDGVDGQWIVKGVGQFGGGTISNLWTIIIDGTTLAGTYTHAKVQKLGPTQTTSDQAGTAHVVKNADGSVTMTTDAAKITLSTTNAFGGAKTVTIDGDGRLFLWEAAASGQCP